MKTMALRSVQKITAKNPGVKLRSVEKKLIPYF
jgi:hypothetical protein